MSSSIYKSSLSDSLYSNITKLSRIHLLIFYLSHYQNPFTYLLSFASLLNFLNYFLLCFPFKEFQSKTFSSSLSLNSKNVYSASGSLAISFSAS